jgi:ABC-type proline/glycine betaine transport system substrate-binding protein
MTGAPEVTESVDELYQRVASAQGDFWNDVYRPFMDRDLNRAQVRTIVRKGFDAAQWNYRRLLDVFHLPADDYQRFMDFLRHHSLKPQSDN